MKKSIQLAVCFLFALFAAVTVSSCDKDTDPADKDFFIGTYSGHISYNDGETSISKDDGTINVVKVGDTYSFIFNGGIPDLKGVKFDKKSANTYVSIGTGLTGITITESSLTMLVSKDGKTWTANCKRGS